MLPRELASAARSSPSEAPLPREPRRGRAPLQSAPLLLLTPPRILPSQATATSMASDEDHIMDFFSQAPSHHPASQGSSSHGGSASGFFNPGTGMGFPDLNSNADSFPDLASYQHILQPDELAGHALPPIGPGRKSGRGAGRSRSLNLGSGSGSQMRPFVPPGAAAGDGGSMSQADCSVELMGCGA